MAKKVKQLPDMKLPGKNAQAIAKLQGEVSTLSRRVDILETAIEAEQDEPKKKPAANKPVDKPSVSVTPDKLSSD